MANDFELLVSREKFDNRVSTLQNYLTQLKGYASRYEDLKNSTHRVFGGDSEKVNEARNVVQSQLNKVNNAITATEEAIKVLSETSSKFDETSANVGQALQDAVAIAADLFI